MLRVGSPYSDQLHAVRDAVLAARAADPLRSSRPSAREWYAGRSVFITGGSGFMGRVLVEFLLRCFPEIGNVYLLLRTKRGTLPQDRLNALLDVPLFDRLRSEQPEALAKVVAVPGDMEALSLGIAPADRQLLCDEVSVVFHVAASVRFDDSFQKAVFTNVRSSRELVQLARDMPQLKVLMHVSTAYCNINQNPLQECVYPSDLDWRMAIRLAELPDHHTLDLLGDKILGFHPNTYVFSKALAEQLMQDAATDFGLPIIITRPSIVVGSYSDPLPGWIDNLNGLGGFGAGFMKGVLRVMYGDGNVSLDSIPVDTATKMIILASWARGIGERISPGPVDVVNAVAGPLAGISIAEHVAMAAVIRTSVPYPGCVRTPHLTVTKNKVVYAALFAYRHLLFGVLMDTLSRLAGLQPRLMHIYRKASVAVAATAPFRIDYTIVSDNQLKLQAMSHPADKQLDYINNYSYRDSLEKFTEGYIDIVRGVLKYTLKEEESVEKNSKDYERAKWIGIAYHVFSSLVLFGLLFLSLRASSEPDFHEPAIAHV